MNILERLKARFDQKWVVDSDSGCWVWTGGITSHGYGNFWIKPREVKAHAAAMFIYKNIPLDSNHPSTMKCWDHKCQNRKCVNPDHLRLVSTKENTLWGDSPHAKNARKTHCIKGHRFTKDSTYIPPKNPNGRACKKCWAEISRLQRKRIKSRKEGRVFDRNTEEHQPFKACSCGSKNIVAIKLLRGHYTPFVVACAKCKRSVSGKGRNLSQMVSLWDCQ